MAETAVAARRSWNVQIWIGFVVAMVAFASYMVIFFRFPITRDVPWVNWLLFASGAKDVSGEGGPCGW